VPSEFRIGMHARTKQIVFEVWYDGERIASLLPADGPGVRVLSKHRLAVDCTDAPRGGVGVVTVRIGGG